MQSKSAGWRWMIWIACCAVLMNVLAPSISHAVAAGGGSGTWQICRTGTAAATGQPDQQSAPDKAAPMADCGYCLAHAGSFALMPPGVGGLGLMGGHAPRPFLFYHAPQPLLAVSAAPPRGPPGLA